ncbi:MAG: RHS repeat-associated core domain-containing protein, partial [Anaerovoracaceae bacterium]
NETALVELKEISSGDDEDGTIENPGGGEEFEITPPEEGKIEEEIGDETPSIENDDLSPALMLVPVSATREKEYFYQDGTLLYTADSVGQLIDEKSLNTYSSSDSSYDFNAMNSKLTNYQDELSAFNILGSSGNIIATERDLEESSLSSSKDNKAYYFYNKDVRGSTTNILDIGNKVDGAFTPVVSYKYDQFGETEIFDNTNEESDITNINNEICYTGGIYDKNTQLHYLNARYYNPENARFISQDTYRGDDNEYGSWNLYTYCANDPVNFIDPSGHKNIKIPFKDKTLKPKGMKKLVNKAKKKDVKAIKKLKKIRKWHYFRNKGRNINLPKNKKEAKSMGYSKNPGDWCHQFSASTGKRNIKFNNKTGHKEVVFNNAGTKIVKDSRDRGSYNFGEGSKHTSRDVYPWIYLGNFPDDTTSVGNRIAAYSLLLGKSANRSRKVAAYYKSLGGVPSVP